MEEDKTKGRTWNGYVCPGCRTVFRVAADFIGVEVMCPSCKETLRLPKTPEEVPHHTIDTGNPAAVAPVEPVRAHVPAQDTPTPAPRPFPVTADGRMKLALALLLLLSLAAAAFLLFPPGESAPEKTVLAPAPSISPETTTPEKPAPPPPPVAVSEMPEPAPPALPESEDAPEPEIAVVQPVPEQPAAPAAGISNGMPETAPEPVPPPAPPETGLVEVIPPTPAPAPAPEQPAPVAAPKPKPEPEPAAAPVQRSHTVVRGDTLNRIASKYQVSITAIKKANGMKSDVVRLGAKLVIPPARP